MIEGTNVNAEPDHDRPAVPRYFLRDDPVPGETGGEPIPLAVKRDVSYFGKVEHARMRNDFERWVNNPHMLNRQSEPRREHEYEHPWTAGAWSAWQELHERVAQERERWEQERKDYRSLLMQARVVLRGPHAEQNIVVRELVARIEARGVQFGVAVQPPETGKTEAMFEALYESLPARAAMYVRRSVKGE